MEKQYNADKGFLGIERLTKGPWQAFERAIARLLAHSNWDSFDVVGGSGDKGADILGSVNGTEKIFQSKYSTINQPLSVDIVGDAKRAIEFYGIKSAVCVSNRLLGQEQKRKLEVLVRQGYDIQTLTGKRLLDSYNNLPTWPKDNRALRPYQKEALEKIISSFESGSKASLVTLATGLGKTYVAGCFLRWLFEHYPTAQILILADKKELLLQFDKSIWTNIPKQVSTHILHESEKPSYTDGIILSTFQSFSSFINANSDIQFDIVIVDEAHHAPAETYRNIIEFLNPKFLLGLTATPFRSDSRSVVDLFGEPIIKFDVIRAMKRGYLANVDYRIMNDNIDVDWVSKESIMGYTIRQLNKKIFIPQRDEEICKIIIDQWNFKKPKRGIVFCNSSFHAERIEQILRSSFQFPARSLTVRVAESDERAKRLRLFRVGEIKIITCYDMLNEGVDIPDVDFLVYLRVTHSRSIFLQQLGRGLRYQDNKTLLVLDFVSDLRRIAGLGLFKKEYDIYHEPKGIIEEISLPSNFSLEFSNQSTSNFINLVQMDATELEDSDLDSPFS